MKVYNKTVYECDYCKKLLKIKFYAERHEKRCFKNPDNYRPCLCCKHLEKKEYRLHFDTWCGEDSKMIKVFYCKEVKSFLYPPIVEHKKNAIDLGMECNEPMKKDCEIYNEESRRRSQDAFSALFKNIKIIKVKLKHTKEVTKFIKKINKNHQKASQSTLVY